MSFSLYSPVFMNSERMAVRYTADGSNLSPPLRWCDVPEGTQSFALVCDDPDAGDGPMVHWVLYDIPAEVHAIDGNLPAQQIVLQKAKHGRNDFGTIGYSGPAPPPGSLHRYFFKLYALEDESQLEPGATCTDLTAAIEYQILGQARLMVLYERIE
jgi:Raf kinase inhibitor-like YbhB/YbcL family protein